MIIELGFCLKRPDLIARFFLRIARRFSIFALLAAIFLLSACSTPPPKSRSNVCKIFEEYPKWYWASSDARDRWGVPIHVQMAIIHQESDFQDHVKPPRKKVLGFIPWRRPTSAKGYTQALDGTWERYKRSVDKTFASRSNFSDSVDFIGWYLNEARDRIGISKSDAYVDYLTYHEGAGGYAKKTYLKKPWLMQVARKVERRSNAYSAQLEACEARLPKKPWWRFWS